MFRFILITALVALASASMHVPSQISHGGRIVGGVATTIEEYPYQLALDRNAKRWCGASIIKPNIALTATHCTVGKLANEFKVRGGATYHGRGGEVADVLQICEHPKYNPRFDYDVSVLLLNRSLPLSDSIQTISIQPVGVEVAEGTLGTVTGWGRLASGGLAASQLQKVDVPKVNHETCKLSYPFKLTDRMVCYGYTEGGKDSCQGDSGGPIVVNGTQVGIVSWGRGCARPGVPGVYSRFQIRKLQIILRNVSLTLKNNYVFLNNYILTCKCVIL